MTPLIKNDASFFNSSELNRSCFANPLLVRDPRSRFWQENFPGDLRRLIVSYCSGHLTMLDRVREVSLSGFQDLELAYRLLRHPTWPGCADDYIYRGVSLDPSRCGSAFFALPVPPEEYRMTQLWLYTLSVPLNSVLLSPREEIQQKKVDEIKRELGFISTALSKARAYIDRDLSGYRDDCASLKWLLGQCQTDLDRTRAVKREVKIWLNHLRQIQENNFENLLQSLLSFSSYQNLPRLEINRTSTRFSRSKGRLVYSPSEASYRKLLPRLDQMTAPIMRANNLIVMAVKLNGSDCTWILERSSPILCTLYCELFPLNNTSVLQTFKVATNFFIDEELYSILKHLIAYRTLANYVGDQQASEQESLIAKINTLELIDPLTREPLL